jgi:hypothetical protein
MCRMPILVIGCVYVMGGERCARWGCRMLESKDTKNTQECSTQFIYLRS